MSILLCEYNDQYVHCCKEEQATRKYAMYYKKPTALDMTVDKGKAIVIH